MSLDSLKKTIFPFGLEVSKGDINGWIAVNKFGKNTDIDIGTEDIWGGGGTWVAPTTARRHNIKSTDNTNDNAAGTGALTVTVYGLNGSFALTEETITMNGTTNVLTTNSYVIIYRLIVATAGSSGNNTGTITATAETDATVTCTITIGKGQSQIAIYQIPANYTGYLFQFSGGADSTSNVNVGVELFIKPFGGAWNLKGAIMIGANSNSYTNTNFSFPLKITEKSIIKLTGTADAVDTDVVGTFDLILIPN